MFDKNSFAEIIGLLLTVILGLIYKDNRDNSKKFVKPEDQKLIVNDLIDSKLTAYGPVHDKICDLKIAPIKESVHEIKDDIKEIKSMIRDIHVRIDSKRKVRKARNE